ncbi:MAG: histidine kinase [Chloroflexi bacterium]|jgi:hypothetical protein|nr:histidine kinase [Chloroflexota bacterium]
MNPRIQELEQQIKEIKDRWPKHSVQPWLLQQLEELEDELAALTNEDANHRAENP